MKTKKNEEDGSRIGSGVDKKVRWVSGDDHHISVGYSSSRTVVINKSEIPVLKEGEKTINKK